MTKQITLIGSTYELHSGAKIFVGVNSDHADTEEGGYYIKFTHPGGWVTKIRLSDAAYECLVAAKPDVDLIKNVRTAVHFSEETEDAESPMDCVYVESPPRTDD
jgi:hypothetical protein